MEITPIVSVIVPTYRDWHRLNLCLNALRNQSVSSDAFEILVVNNDAENELPDQLELPENALMISESERGSYAARNTGAAAAKGKIFAFTDADCLPDRFWLSFIINFYQSPGTENALFAGDVVLFSELNGESNLNFAESYDLLFGIRQKEYAEQSIAATANLAVTRKLFFLVDGFRRELKSGGDTDFCRRAVNAGGRFVFQPKCIVRHPLRSNMADIITKSRRLVGGRIKCHGWWASAYILLPPVVRLKKILKMSDVPIVTRLKVVNVVFTVKVFQILEFLLLALRLKKEESR